MVCAGSITADTSTAACISGGATSLSSTLFRLPLRTVDQASCSLLSRRPVGVDDVRRLLAELSAGLSDGSGDTPADSTQRG